MRRSCDVTDLGRLAGITGRATERRNLNYNQWFQSLKYCYNYKCSLDSNVSRDFLCTGCFGEDPSGEDESPSALGSFLAFLFCSCFFSFFSFFFVPVSFFSFFSFSFSSFFSFSFFSSSSFSSFSFSSSSSSLSRISSTTTPRSSFAFLTCLLLPFFFLSPPPEGPSFIASPLAFAAALSSIAVFWMTSINNNNQLVSQNTHQTLSPSVSLS